MCALYRLLHLYYVSALVFIVMCILLSVRIAGYGLNNHIIIMTDITTVI